MGNPPFTLLGISISCNLRLDYIEKNCAVFIYRLQIINRLKKFKHTNEELELAKQQSEKEKKKKQLEE